MIVIILSQYTTRGPLISQSDNFLGFGGDDLRFRVVMIGIFDDETPIHLAGHLLVLFYKYCSINIEYLANQYGTSLTQNFATKIRHC